MHIVVTILKCAGVLSVLGFLGIQAYRVHLRVSPERQAEKQTDQVPPLDLKEGKKIVKLNKELIQAHGIETETAQAVSWRERVTVYGRVVPNPRATYEVRSPFAGTLAADNNYRWPMPGQTIKPGQLLGSVTLRVGPQERLDLQTKLADARLKFDGAEKIVRVREAALDRLNKIKGTTVPQRELDEANVQLLDAQTLLATTKGALDIWQQAQDEMDRAAEKNTVWSRPLLVPFETALQAPLELTELCCQPGTTVEAGGLVFKLVDFSRVLLRLDLPAEMLKRGAPPNDLLLSQVSAPAAALRGALNRVEAPTPDAALPATLVGPAAQVDASSQFVGYYYLATITTPTGQERKTRLAWRPGFFVQTEIPVPGAGEQDGVAVPASAVLYHQGRTLVYVQIDDVRFERREVQVLGYEGGRFVVAIPALIPDGRGVEPNEKVVSSGAQILLSAEFRRDVDND